jgi:hypothetical protein
VRSEALSRALATARQKLRPGLRSRLAYKASWALNRTRLRLEGEIAVRDVGGPVTVVAFAALDLDKVIPRFGFRRTLSTMGVNQIYVRDFRLAWYQLGLKNTPGGLEGSVREIGRRTERLGAPAIAVGNSMGGYAAMLFASRLGLPGALVFGPQTVLDTATLTRFDDNRWTGPYAALQRLGKPLIDLREELDGSTLPIHVWYGSDEARDVRHAEHLASLDNVTLHSVTAAHDLPTLMVEQGRLQQVILEFIAGLGLEMTPL